MSITRFSEEQQAIIAEISRAFQALGGEKEVGFFAALHSWGDTLPDGEILSMLREYNEKLSTKQAEKLDEPMLVESYDQCTPYWLVSFAGPNPPEELCVTVSSRGVGQRLIDLFKRTR